MLWHFFGEFTQCLYIQFLSILISLQCSIWDSFTIKLLPYICQDVNDWLKSDPIILNFNRKSSFLNSRGSRLCMNQSVEQRTDCTRQESSFYAIMVYIWLQFFSFSFDKLSVFIPCCPLHPLSSLQITQSSLITSISLLSSVSIK